MDLIEGYATWEDFHREWYPRIVWVGRKRGLADPESFAQDMMELLVRKDYLERHRQFRGQKSAKTWINNLVYRRAWNAVRDASRRPQSAVEYSDELNQTPKDGMAEVEAADLQMRIRDILDRRSGEKVAQIWDMVCKQVSQDEVGPGGKVRILVLAEDLGISQGAARKRMAEFRLALEEHGLDRMLGRVG